MRYLIVLLISTGVWAQQFTPTYSTARVQQLAAAIGHAEGFGVRHAKPTRFHNPGDLKTLGKYRVFRTDAEGWAALQAQIVRILLGHSLSVHAGNNHQPNGPALRPWAAVGQERGQGTWRAGHHNLAGIPLQRRPRRSAVAG